jgi:hypothetical protein
MTGEAVAPVPAPLPTTLVEKRYQHLVIAGQVVHVDGDQREPELHSGGDRRDGLHLEERDVRRPTGIDQGCWRSDRLLYDRRPGTGPMSRRAVERPCEPKLTAVIDV